MRGRMFGGSTRKFTGLTTGSDAGAVPSSVAHDLGTADNHTVRKAGETEPPRNTYDDVGSRLACG